MAPSMKAVGKCSSPAIVLVLVSMLSAAAAAGIPGSVPCKHGDTPSPCLVDPCRNLVCNLKPWQKCVSNYCNKPVLFLGTVVKGPCGAVIVDTTTKKVVPTCPLPAPIKCRKPHQVQCLIDPCKNIETKCVLDKGVVCVPKYCSGPVKYYGQIVKSGPCSAVLINRNTLKIVKCKAPVPEFCFELYQPVCGVDGKTYSNSCFLAKAKVQKAYDGECKCYTKVYKPVCGSDQKTYATPCKAKAAGVTYTDGACVTKPCNALCSLNVDCAKSTSPCKANPKLRCEIVTCAKQHLTASGEAVNIHACAIVYFNKLTGYLEKSCTV